MYLFHIKTYPAVVVYDAVRVQTTTYRLIQWDHLAAPLTGRYRSEMYIGIIHVGCIIAHSYSEQRDTVIC